MPETVWHSLEEINGIGPALASRISAIGLPAAECLLRGSSVAVAQDIEHVNGVSLDNAMVDFIPQAALLRLPGIDGDALRVLHEHRITYARLAYGDTDDLVSLLNREGVAADASQVMRWQIDAARRIGKGTVLLQVSDVSGVPEEGADVFVSDPPRTGDGIAWRWTSGKDGWAIVEYLARGLHEIDVQKGEFYQRVKISIGEGERLCLHIRLERSAPNGIIYDERRDGIDPRQRPWIRRSVDSMDAFAIGELLEVTAITDETLRLSTVLRRQEGASWIVESIRLPLAEVGLDTEIGAVYEWLGDSFERRAETAQSIRDAMQLESIVSSFTRAGPGG